MFEGLPLAGTHLLGTRDRLQAPTLVPRVDIIESSTDITARFELPGFELGGLEVTVEDNVLTVKGSRDHELAEGATYRHRELADGGFSRSVTLADKRGQRSGGRPARQRHPGGSGPEATRHPSQDHRDRGCLSVLSDI